MGTDHTYRYVNATNVYNKGKADGGTCTLLWTNSGDTLINFVAQTISINLTNYTGVIIQFRAVYSVIESDAIAGGWLFACPRVYIPKTNTAFQYCGGVANGSGAMREINSITNSGINFGNAYYIQPGSQTFTGNFAIPYKIYGIKCQNLPTSAA